MHIHFPNRSPGLLLIQRARRGASILGGFYSGVYGSMNNVIPSIKYTLEYKHGASIQGGASIQEFTVFQPLEQLQLFLPGPEAEAKPI